MSAISGFNTTGRGVNADVHGSPMHLCPKCNSYTNYRLENGKMFDRFLFWMPLRRYLCTNCTHKFFILAR